MPAVDLEVVNFFQPPTALRLVRSRRPVPHSKTNSGGAPSAQNNQQRVPEFHDSFSTPTDRNDEAEDVFLPADQLRLGSSDLGTPIHSVGLRSPTPAVTPSPTMQKIQRSLFSPFAQANQGHQSTIDHPIVIEDDDDGSDDNEDSSASALTMADSTMSDELTAISTDISTDTRNFEKPAPRDSNYVQSSPSQFISPNQSVPLNEDCSDEPEEDVPDINKAQDVPRSPFRLGEPLFPATETSHSAIEQGSDAGIPANERDVSPQCRDETPHTAWSCQTSNPAENPLDLNKRDWGPTQQDYSIDRDHTSDQNESDNEHPRLPVKRRRMRQYPAAMISTPSTTRCSPRRLRPRRRQDRSSSLQLCLSSCDNMAACPVEPQVLPRPATSECDDALISFSDAPHQPEQIMAAEFKEFAFQGVMKCTTIGMGRMIALEFSLPDGVEDVSLPMRTVEYGSTRSVLGPNRRKGPPKYLLGVRSHLVISGRQKRRRPYAG